MIDFRFGNRLLVLRKRAGLSQAQLGEKLGVSNKLISKWETGRAKPGLDIVKSLADHLGVSIDELFRFEEDTKQISKIVITGGPCAGKTTAMSWIQNAFTQRGYHVLFVDETATQLINGGAAPWTAVSMKEFQLSLIKLQQAKEAAFHDIAMNMQGDKVLIVCDRGVMDNRAYMSEEDFSWICKRMGSNLIELRDSYDAVFHLVTAAKGAEKYYTLANNQARTETPEQAAALDDKLISVWTGHPHFRVIDNSTDFNQKMVRLISEISSFLGEPSPREIERKYLIDRPSARMLEQLPNCRMVDIIQTYLKSENGEEIRIRQRGRDGHYIYFKTHKGQLDENGLIRFEKEERLTQEDYLTLLNKADPAYRPIHKQRYCLSANGLYYEIDLYPEWKDKAIMEIELHSEDQEIVFPDGIEVIREVTGENEYSNHMLAKL